MLTAFSASLVEVNAQSEKERQKEAQKAAKKVEEKIGKLTKEAEKSINKKDYKTALDKYDQAIQLAPKNPKTHFLKGKAHYELKEFDQSLTEFDTALIQGYETPLEIYKLRWRLNYERKNFDVVLDDAQKILQVEPSNLPLYQTIGAIYLAKQSYNEALAAFQKVTQLDPNDADTYYYTALAYQKLGDVPKQQSSALEAVKRNTKFSGESYFILGDAEQKLKNYNEAVEAYRKSLLTKSDNAATYHNLSDIFRSQNRFDEAIEVLKKGVVAFPNDAYLYIDLSLHYTLADQSASAIGAAQQAVKFLPGKPDSHASLCRAYYENKQFQPALEACNAALKLNHNDGEANVYLGFTYLSLDKIETANTYFVKAVNGLKDYTQKNSDYSDAYYLLGNAYYYANQPKNAIDAYSRSLQLYPQSAKARFNLGLAYFVNGDLTAAREQYEVLAKLDKDLAAKLKQTLDKPVKTKSEK
jgi:tetratricopeptide (TPR) repeat protein